jgi:hypothetical protein
MAIKRAIEFTLPHDVTRFDGSFVGGGTQKIGRNIYRVVLRAGEKPHCTINGEDYKDPHGKVDTAMWDLLVAVRKRFNA